VTRHRLPDGRVVVVEPTFVDAGRTHWHCRLEGKPEAEIVGWPLNSTLAELLGYEVAREEWPPWINELAAEIESEKA
jgi:hypothetical protein